MVSFSNSKFNDSRQTTTPWERFVSICTRSLGGFYRPDGTIFRDAKQSSQGGDLDFADLTQRTHLRLRHQETLRQMNIEAITHRAYEQIDSDSSMRAIDEDWFALFINYAQDISNPSMRELWASALALEISQPGSVSKHSLGFMRNCDAWELAAFRRVAASAFIAANGHPFIFKAKGHISATDPIFSEHRLLSHCVSAGLVDDQATPLTAGFSFTYEGARQVVQRDPFIRSDNVGYYVQRFTRIGSDLYKLLNQADKKSVNGKQKQVVWDFLTDYLELSVEEAVVSN